MVIRFDARRIYDIGSISVMGKQLLRLVRDSNPVRIVLNFEGVEAVVSAFIGEMIALHQDVKRKRGKLYLCCVHTAVLEILRLMQIDKLFTVYDSEEDAVTEAMLS